MKSPGWYWIRIDVATPKIANERLSRMLYELVRRIGVVRLKT